MHSTADTKYDYVSSVQINSHGDQNWKAEKKKKQPPISRPTSYSVQHPLNSILFPKWTYKTYIELVQLTVNSPTYTVHAADVYVPVATIKYDWKHYV